MNRRVAAPITAALLLAAAPLAAQTVRGTVVDAATEVPVAGARITVLEGTRRVGRARTAEDGTFSVELRRPATVVVLGERLGYRPATSEPVALDRRETVELRLPLSEGTVALQAVTVTARRQPPRVAQLDNVGFYERESRGFGRFLRREDIERFPSRDVAQVIDRLPGTTLLSNHLGSAIVFDRSIGEGMLGSGGASLCLPLVYLDGVRVSYDVTGITGLAPVERIEAIETYSGPSQVQPPFGGTGASCGVIAIWTRTTP
jgi:hypothetical protein